MEKIIGRGAEAILIQKNKFLIKKRVKKGYRHPLLDTPLRKGRTRKESRILDKASKLLTVPKIYDVDEQNCNITMDFIPGKRLSEHLDKFNMEKSLKICKEIGEKIAILHKADIIHGDLTTSNMILHENKVWIIDFGLGFISTRNEDKAVDLHLMKQALESKHFLHWQEYFKKIIEGYKIYDGSDAVLNQFKKVEERGRYKRKMHKWT
jgi:TP53 regulating kinase-like protein